MRQPNPDSSAYGNANRDRHIHSDGNSDGNGHIHSDGDCNGNAYANTDGNSNCHSNVDSNGYGNCHSNGDCDRNAAGYTDSAASADTESPCARVRAWLVQYFDKWTRWRPQRHNECRYCGPDNRSDLVSHDHWYEHNRVLFRRYQRQFC